MELVGLTTLAAINHLAVVVPRTSLILALPLRCHLAAISSYQFPVVGA